MTAVGTSDVETEPVAGVARVRLRAELDLNSGRGKKDLLESVRRNMGSDWTVSPLFPDAVNDPEISHLARFFTVTGTVPIDDPTRVPQTSWDLSYGLGDSIQFADRIEPDLVHANFGICQPPSDLPGTDVPSWALAAMRCPGAWGLQLPGGGKAKGEGIVVAHPDTGYTDHPELDSVLDLSRDFDVIDNDHNAIDPLQGDPLLFSPGHGTHTSSVIASRETGTVTGSAPQCTVLPIRTVVSVWRNVLDTHVAAAIAYARQQHCHVVSMSLGGLWFIGAEEIINAAVQDGMIVLAAAGNCVGFVTWPAAYTNCIAVAATTIKDEPSSYSCHGGKVFVSAPGESIWCATWDRGKHPPAPTLGRDTGTSFAVAHVAGIAALWLAFHGRDQLIAAYGASNVQRVFMQTVRDHGHRVPANWDAGQFGVGIIDARALLEAPLPAPDSLPPADAVVPFAAPVRPDPVDLIGTVVPELTHEQVRRQLATLLGVEEADLPPKLDRYGAELLYLLGEDSTARTAFVQSEGVDAPVSGPSLRAVFRDRSSGSLQKEISPNGA